MTEAFSYTSAKRFFPILSWYLRTLFPSMQEPTENQPLRMSIISTLYACAS